jgi:hypothetical protein
MGVFDSEVYKCVLGMDIIRPLKMVVDFEARTATMRDKENHKFTIQLVTKGEVRQSRQLRDFK